MKGGKLWALLLVLVVLSSAFALAADSTEDITVEQPVLDDSPRVKHGQLHRMDMVITKAMDHYGLTEDDSIGDLLNAIQATKEERKDKAMDHFDVETEEELRDAIKDQKIETLRDRLALSEDLSDEEVLEAAKEARMEAIKETLGLSQDATAEEVEAAWQAWIEENRVLLPGLKSGLHFFRGFF